MVDRLVVLALRLFPIHPPRLLRTRQLPRRRRLLPILEREPTILITRWLGLRESALQLFQFQVDVLRTQPCWHAAREPMVVRRVEFVLRHFHLHPPRLLPTRQLLLPRRPLPSLVKAPTTPTTHLLGLRASALPLFQCQVDVLPTRRCSHAARLPMVDRRAVLALRHFLHHPPRLPPTLPRLLLPRLLPSQVKEPTIPTPHWLGLRESALQPYQYPVDVLRIRRC
jgi:hypothetical protein